MDHSHAHFIALKKDKVQVDTVVSEIEAHIRYKGETADGTKLAKKRATNNEYQKHQKEQNQLHKYYKVLADKLEKYDTVYLFGPTTAKNELLNWIRDKKKVKGKTFVVDSAEEMTFNQMVAKVKAVLGTK